MPETWRDGLFLPEERAEELRAREGEEREQRRRVTRRLAVRWLGWGGVAALLGQWATGALLGFLWPRKVGAFGGTVSAGSVTEYEVGDVKVVREGKFYLTRVPEGFLALWWKCPHLGCTVPWKEAEPAEGGPPGQGDVAFAQQGRFHCPCHQSRFNRYGQVVYGPAPRPMTMFPLRIENGKIMVETGPEQAISRRVAEPSDATPA